MAQRYEDIDQATLNIFEDVRQKWFGEFDEVMFKLIFDLELKKKGNKWIFAYIKSMNKLSRFFTAEEAQREDGYDFCIVLNKKLWDVLDEADKIRILRHELRHVEQKTMKKKTKYVTRDHTITDFYEDVDIESKAGGDPRWAERLAIVLEALCDEENEEE